MGTKRGGAILSGSFFPIALFARKQFVSELSGRTIAFAVRDRPFTKMDWVSSFALGRPHSYKEEWSGSWPCFQRVFVFAVGYNFLHSGFYPLSRWTGKVSLPFINAFPQRRNSGCFRRFYFKDKWYGTVIWGMKVIALVFGKSEAPLLEFWNEHIAAG